MHPSELESVRRAGRNARRAGADYFEGNPNLLAPVPIDTTAQFDDWASLCNAWWAGWLEEDAGRTESVQNYLRHPGPR